jgi:hypothetical protein
MNEAQAEGTEMKFIVAIFESEKLQLRLQKRKCSLDFFATFLIKQKSRESFKKTVSDSIRLFLNSFC